MFFERPQQCPACGSGTIWRSKRSPLRWPARLILLHPIRCGSCDRLFWRFTANPPGYAPRTRVRADGSKVVPHKTRTPHPTDAGHDTPLPPIPVGNG